MCLAMVMTIPVINAIAKTMALEYHILQVVWARFSGHRAYVASCTGNVVAIQNFSVIAGMMTPLHCTS